LSSCLNFFCDLLEDEIVGIYIGCFFFFFKFHLKVGVEESIVSAPLVSLQSKNTNNPKSEVSFKQLIRDLIHAAFTIDSSTATLAYFEVKFKNHDII
jgi:hypothetical protein